MAKADELDLFIQTKWANGTERVFSVHHISQLRKELNTDGTFTYSLRLSGVDSPFVITRQLYEKLLETIRPIVVQIGG